MTAASTEKVIAEIESLAAGLCGGHYEPKSAREGEIGGDLLTLVRDLRATLGDVAADMRAHGECSVHTPVRELANRWADRLSTPAAGETFAQGDAPVVSSDDLFQAALTAYEDAYEITDSHCMGIAAALHEAYKYWHPKLEQLQARNAEQAAELAEARGAAEELSARRAALQRALGRWLPQIAGNPTPEGDAAANDAWLLFDSGDDVPAHIDEWYGQKIWERLEAAEKMSEKRRQEMCKLLTERNEARAKLTALAAGIEGLEKRWREHVAQLEPTGGFAPIRTARRETYQSCADDLKALREGK